LQKRIALLLFALWEQFSLFFHTEFPNDIIGFLFSILSDLFIKENYLDQELKEEPNRFLTCRITDINIYDVKRWFFVRLFERTHSPPVLQVYEWLFYWFGFNNESWKNRERSYQVAQTILFLQQLIKNNTFFFRV